MSRSDTLGRIQCPVGTMPGFPAFARLPLRLAVAGLPFLGAPAERTARRRWQSVEARRLALGLLPGESWQWGADAEGRPCLHNAAGARGPDVSISHSGNWVAAGVAARGRVGIDLEIPRPGRDPLRLARAYFSAAEIRWVAAEGEAAFLACWTMREAVAKLTGGGLAAALALDGAALLAGRNGMCRFGAGWVGHWDWGGGHLALAWSEAPDPLVF